MDGPQPIDPPRKKVERPQIAFNLNEEEARLKDDFVRLVGSRGTKPVLVEFIRRYVEYGGKLSTVGAGESAPGAENAPSSHAEHAKAITPQTSDEEILVAALLMVMRERNEDARERVENLRLILKRRIEKIQAREPNNHVA